MEKLQERGLPDNLTGLMQALYLFVEQNSAEVKAEQGKIDAIFQTNIAKATELSQEESRR